MSRVAGRILGLLVIGVMLHASGTIAQDDRTGKAAQVKAAFLYNFLKFVEWPSDKAPFTTGKANICIVGESPFGDNLEKLRSSLTGKVALNIITDVTSADVGECHILYIGGSDHPEWSNLLTKAQARSVLTVSEINNFADTGGIVEMKTVEKSIGLFSSNKINLRINLKSADASSLKVSAQLLEIAAEVIK